MWCLLVGVVWASEPDVRVLDDKQTVRGTVDISADVEATRAVICDAWKTAEAGGADTKLADKGTDGDCQIVEYTVVNVIKTVRYTARQCPTPEGSLATLVESPDMEAFRAEFKIEEVTPGQSRVVYEVYTKPSFPVPRFVVRTQTSREVTSFLRNLKKHLE